LNIKIISILLPMLIQHVSISCINIKKSKVTIIDKEVYKFKQYNKQNWAQNTRTKGMKAKV